ncbi:MAG: hypothetical protein A2104_02515 [Candidatus Melainabacteria bacterium GWF2_32_7]|nr:MAG: hypothetical protein A2104_02515 [Candidatus Melainabacteria bacterium GWF2_32_7]
MNIPSTNPMLSNNQSSPNINRGKTDTFAAFNNINSNKKIDTPNNNQIPNKEETNKTPVAQNSIGVVNPPNISKYDPLESINKKKENNNSDPNTSSNTDKNPSEGFFKNLINNPKKLLIITGIGVLIAAIARGEFSKLKNGKKFVENIDELKSYIKELTEKIIDKPKKIKIQFPVEKYQKYLKKSSQKEYIELNSREVQNLKTIPQRIKDIVRTINGTFEAVRRSPSDKIKQKVNIVLDETARGREKEILKILENQGRIDDAQAKQLAGLLKDVIRVETTPMNPGVLLSAISNPVTVEVGTYNYIKTGNVNILRRISKWIAEAIL